MLDKIKIMKIDKTLLFFIILLIIWICYIIYSIARPYNVSDRVRNEYKVEINKCKDMWYWFQYDIFNAYAWCCKLPNPKRPTFIDYHCIN